MVAKKAGFVSPKTLVTCTFPVSSMSDLWNIPVLATTPFSLALTVKKVVAVLAFGS